MNTINSPSVTAGDAATLTRTRMIVYWVATVFVAGNALIAGAMNILRIQPLHGMLLHLGYPAYFGTMLGIWKVLGALVLLAPRYPLFKEWAYAGSFIDYIAATVSYVAIGEGSVGNLVGPIMSIAFLGLSWAERPLSRRLAAS
jgi:DoxX-like family